MHNLGDIRKEILKLGCFENIAVTQVNLVISPELFSLYTPTLFCWPC